MPDIQIPSLQTLATLAASDVISPFTGALVAESTGNPFGTTAGDGTSSINQLDEAATQPYTSEPSVQNTASADGNRRAGDPVENTNYPDAILVDAPPSSDTDISASGGGSTPASVAAVAASRDPRIDGLLSGTKWSGSSITYSDPLFKDYYGSDYFVDNNGDNISAQNESFSHISANELQAVRNAFDGTYYDQPGVAPSPRGAAGFSVNGFTNLDVGYRGYGVIDRNSGFIIGTIRIANTSDNVNGFTFYPSTSNTGGDVWLGTAIQSPVQGNFAYNNTLHELGHSLGLKHGQDTGGPANTALPSDVDSLEYSVMTYRSYVGGPATGYTNEAYGYPQTYMMLDIAALQYMYGADFSSSAANVGDTVYTWNPTTGQSYINGVLATNPGSNRIFETIWDGGGTDTYDFSNYATNLDIDLSPGGDSTFSTAQLAYLGGGPNGGYARGNVFNALQYHNDARSLIENAVGGSGNDTIVGNQGANVLTGGAGNDTLNGGAGADAMVGGVGNDTYIVDNAGDTVVEQAAEGFDTVYSSVDYTLSPNVESLILYGSAVRGTGNAGSNYLTGTDAANVLDGGGGADIMSGGAGNDTYIVDNPYDYIAEASGGGNDTVYASANYTLGANVENLVQYGASVYGTGNTGDNYINGSSANNVINGGGGVDRLNGGGGHDLYQVSGNNFGYQIISDFVTGGSELDAVSFQNTTLHSFANVLTNSAQIGADTYIGDGLGNEVVLVNVPSAALTANNFGFTA